MVPSKYLFIDGVSIGGGSGIFYPSISLDPVAIFAHTETLGIGGGTFTAGSWFTREVNTEVLSANFATLDSNKFTLQAGTYQIDVDISHALTNRSQTRLYNVTDSVVERIGMCGYANATYGLETNAPIQYFLTLSGPKEFEIQSQVQTTRLTNGGGIPTSQSTETYTQVVVRNVSKLLSTSLLAYHGTSGVNGQTLNANVWQTRDLNTEISDPDNIVTISSNQFTLQAGTYTVDGRFQAWSTTGHVARLYNITDSVVTKYGSSRYSGTWGNTYSRVIHHLTIESITTFEFQHKGLSGGNTGLANSFGGDEEYAQIEIRRYA